MRWRPDFQAVGPHPHAGHRAHRVRQGRHLVEALDHGADDLIGQGQAVDEGRRVVLRQGRVQVPAVFRLNGGAALLQKFRHPQDDPVLDGAGEIAHLPGRGLGLQGHITNHIRDVHVLLHSYQPMSFDHGLSYDRLVALPEFHSNSNPAIGR